MHDLLDLNCHEAILIHQDVNYFHLLQLSKEIQKEVATHQLESYLEVISFILTASLCI